MFWKPKTPKEKDLSDKMNKLKKASTSGQVAIIYDLFQFIPDYTSLILSKFAAKFTENLKNPITDKATSATVDLICHMIEKSDEILQESKNSKDTNPKTDGKTSEYLPYPPFLKQSKFIDYLFCLTSELDERVILMLGKFFTHDGLYFVKWILSQKHPEKSPLMLLFQLVVKTQNLRVGRIAHLLTVSRKEVTAHLIPTIVRPLLKKFPLSIVIDLMVASTEIREIIPFADFEVWLLTHDHFTLSDIEIIVNRLYKELWLSETSIKLFLRSEPPSKMNDIKWISQQDPQTDIDLSYEMSLQAIKQLRPNIEFTGPCEDCETTRDPYMFVRLYVLSFSNPKKIGLDTQNLVIELIKDKDEFVSAAATQCILYWILQYDYQIKPFVVYRVASAAVDEKTSDGLRYLYMSALHLFGQQQDVASAILQAEENLRFTSKLKIKLCRNSWIFPHFKINVPKILTIKLVDYNQAADLVGYITGYLCDTDEEKDEQEDQVQ